MEDWLFKKDNYIPPDDKDSFIDKSVMSILHTLSLIKRSNKLSNKFVYELNPKLKLIFSILNVIFISMSKNYMYVLSVDAFILLILSLLEIREIRHILSLSTIVPIFTFVMLIPSMIKGNISNSILIVLKVIGSVMVINILAYTTKWHHITRSLKSFFVPDLFILIFDITIKYIYILGEYSVEMLYALRLRSVGRNNNKYSSLSKIIGNLFLKSKEMGDEMYSAMECRGFTGEYVSHSKFVFKSKDWIYAISNALVILMYFYLG